MLVDNRHPLECAVPRRWNLLAVPLAVLLVLGVAMLGLRPAAGADEPATDSSGEDTFVEVAEIAQAEEVELEIEVDEHSDVFGTRPVVEAPARGAKRVVELVHTRPKVATHEQVEEIVSTRSSVPPFSGRLRPGDILVIDVAGGFPDAPAGPRTATVEPDGKLALGVLYGRVQVGGKTLSEAEATILKQLQESLKDPRVQVTYDGHDPGVVAEGTVQGATGHTSTRGTRRAAPGDADRRPSAVDVKRIIDTEKRRAEREVSKLLEQAEYQHRQQAAADQVKALTSQIRALQAANAQLERQVDELRKATEKQESPETAPSQR